MTDNDLVLLTSKGQVEALPFSRWREIDKFSTLTKQDPKKRSVILWSPINNLIFADRLRHFIVIKYQDQNDEDNRLLIEYARPDELSEIFEKLKAGWKQYLIRFEKKGN